MTTTDHLLLAPYALDALDASERADYEDHLESCTICHDELLGFEATVARLADSVPAPVPAGLRDRVLEAARTTPQERPVVTRLGDRRRAGGRVVPRLLGAAAAMAIIAGGIGIFVEHDRAEDAQRDRDQISAIMAESDAVDGMVEIGDATLRVTTSDSLDRAAITIGGLPEPADGRDYQMWTLDAEGTPTSAGVLDGDQGVGAHSFVVDDASEVAAVAVSVEPDGGSEQPTEVLGSVEVGA